MHRTRSWRYVVATVLAAAAVISAASAAWAADFTVNFPAGQACSFALSVSGTGGNFATHHETGVTTIGGGTGSALTFTNLSNGKSVSFPSNGAVMITRNSTDGSSTLQLTGHNVVILYPGDTPAGPSTTLVVGRAVINNIPSGETTVSNVLTISGTQTDICALLS